jgi:hypothetical protein
MQLKLLLLMDVRLKEAQMPVHSLFGKKLCGRKDVTKTRTPQPLTDLE